MDAVNKKSLRKKFIEMRNSVSQNILDQKSRSLHEQLFVLESFQRAESVFIYLSFGSELNTFPIIEKALSMGKHVAIPLCKGNELVFVNFRGFKGLVRSPFGVLEPDGGEEIYPDKKSMMLVPGLVFGHDLYRLGYGKGYYDRYLSQVQTMTNMGIGYDFQLTHNLPHESFDVKLDCVLTEERLVF